MEKLLYSVHEMPVFQNIVYASPEAAKDAPRGNIDIVQNTDTGLIYNRSFDPEVMVYDENYQNEQSLSAGFLKHLEEVASIIEKHMGKEQLVEVGCGKGFFLEMLESKGFDVYGFDNAYQGDNPKITKSFFDENSGVKGKGIILRHVLEHIENPLTFLEGLKKSNDGNGLIYIEVPCFDWICENRTWFDICYEHVNYFRLSDLRKIFGKVHASGRLFGGQYLYIVADLASIDVSAVKMDKEASFPPDFLQSVPSGRSAENCVIWGASTKGVIFSLLCQRNGFQINTAVDINPAKQGRYLPVTGVKVLSPEDFMKSKANSVIYVMNSNYYAEIKDMTKNSFEYRKVDNG